MHSKILSTQILLEAQGSCKRHTAPCEVLEQLCFLELNSGVTPSKKACTLQFIRSLIRIRLQCNKTGGISEPTIEERVLCSEFAAELNQYSLLQVRRVLIGLAFQDAGLREHQSWWEGVYGYSGHPSIIIGFNILERCLEIVLTHLCRAFPT